MTVEAPKRTWTDERLDDLSDKVDDGFAKADKKTDDGFAKIDADIRELRGEMRAGFDKMTSWMLGAAAVIIAALIGLIGALLHGPAL